MNSASRSRPRAALITGGARRIGAALTRALAGAQYALAIHWRNSRDAAEILANEIRQSGGRAATVGGDLANREDVRALVPAAVNAIGPLTLMVNNASEFAMDSFGQLDADIVERHFAVNLRAPLFLAQAFAAQAPADADAAIINITDQRVLKPTPRHFSYALSKSALHTATVMMAQALAPKVRVNAVAPGPIFPSSRQRPEDFARQAAAVPLARAPGADEIAAAVLFLAHARGVTGETISVDGGQHIAWQTPDVWGIDE
ncbi:MAG: SDR family oxidoreductase [Proteobacteria bacterium]|nr:SDR family oxidoreductase [Pseudomonadota bacterium]